MKLIHHHIKYKELHGEDVVIIMEHGEHRRLHNRLRKEGKCNISKKELHEISHRAYSRGKNIRQITFYTRLLPHIYLFEYIRYNENTGIASYSAWFKPEDNQILPIIEVDSGIIQYRR